MDRIVVAFANEEAQRRILRLLASDGWEPAACCTSGAEAIRTVRKLGSAIVVCGFKLRDMTATDLAADLLETSDPARAEELARQLCDLNRERQAVEQAICADAIQQIDKLRSEDRNALVLSSENWHQGVVGIVASRLSEKYSCPTVMSHLKDGTCKCSCRSYGGFNLFAAL